MPPIIDTPRLVLRPLVHDDADWVYTLNHDPLWQRFIGDRGVDSMDDAREYIARSQQQMQEWGFSLLAIIEAESDMPLGMCGLIRRPYFDFPEIGFALLEEARGKGYALEATEYTLRYAQQHLALSRILASVHRDNAGSVRLLETAGFRRMGKMFVDGMPDQLLYLYRDDA